MPENKFKAGDRLVAIETYGGVTRGEVVVVDRTATPTESSAWVHLVGKRQHYSFYGSFKESQFKLWQPEVGDRVRIAKACIPQKEGHVGVEFVVTHQEGTLDGEPAWVGRPGSSPYIWKTSELEPLPVAAEAQPAAWVPKIGDRVTANGNTHVNIEQHWNVHFRSKHGDIVDGALVVASVSDCSGSNVGLSNKVGGRSHFYMPANTLKLAPVPLKIEAGKFYKTRDGRKVGPMRLPPWSTGFFDESRSLTGMAWSKDGAFIAGATSSLDLIALWVEPAKPLVAATVDYQADEYGSGVKAEPKFRVGDIVTARSPFGSERRGRITEVDHTDNWLTYRLDDRDTWVTADSVQLVSNDNAPVAEQPAPAKFKVGDWITRDGWDGFYEVSSIRDGKVFVRVAGYSDVHYDLDNDFTVRPITQPTAIVARIDNGQPRPNPTPFVHHSQEAAAKEAARLANLHKGQKFGVYVLTGEPAFVEREYKFTWQKMAARNDVPAAVDELSRAAGIARSDAHFAVRNWLEAA